MTRYEFTPNYISTTLIILLSFIAWKYENNLFHVLFGGTLIYFIFFLVSFFLTPYLIWWAFGVISNVFLKKNKQ